MTASMIRQDPVTELRVDSLSEPQHESWTAYAARHPDATLYHTLAWRDAIGEVFGHEPRYLVARRGDRLTGILPLFLIQFPLLGKKLISIPYDVGSGGPLADDGESERALVEAARRIAIDLGVTFLQLRSGTPRPAIESLGFERSEPVLLSETALDEGDPWARVSSDNRQSIRKADRRGVTVHEADSLADYEAFYRIYLRAFRAFGTPPYGPRYFPTLWSRLGAARHVRLLVASIDRAPVGGLVLFAWQRNFVSKFAACVPEAVPARAFAALYGAAIEMGAREGARRLSWGSSARHQTGLIEFKERWGATTSPAILYSLAVRGKVPSLSAYYDENGLAQRAWRRLPLRLTVALGGLVNRWFC